jgi:HK97 family phage major capsid protein
MGAMELVHIGESQPGSAGYADFLAEVRQIFRLPPGKTRVETKYDAAFSNYVRYGWNHLSLEDQQQLNKIRAAQTVTTTGGGYLVPQGFSNQLEEALKWFGGMWQAAEVFPTGTGSPLPWPTVDDTANAGELLPINTNAALQDFTFGQVNFGAFKYSSKLVQVPIELMQDSYFDLNSFLARMLGERLGRVTNPHFTTGTGTGQPTGIVTAATLGKAGLTGQTTSIIYDDLVDLYHSVDAAHRMSPGARWMMNDSSLKVIKKLKDTSGRPLWLNGYTSGFGSSFPGTILDRPYILNQDVATMAANAKSVLFGDLSKYKIRLVQGTSLRRLDELFAQAGQVGFVAFMRTDGNLVDAGSHPVKFYANSAT